MPRGDAQQRDRRAFRATTPLLPVAERVDAHAQCESKVRLRQPNETPQGCDVVTAFELPLHESLAQSGRNRTGKLLGSQFGNVRHGS